MFCCQNINRDCSMLGKSMIGYVCRPKNSDTVCIAIGREQPSRKEDGWFWHIPGWFASLNIRTFRRKFGFTVKPGMVKKININISERK